MVVSISTITGVARNYVEIFFRRKWLFIVPTFVLFGLSVAYSFTVPPVYRTSAIVLVEEEKVSNPLISGLAVSTSIQDRLETIVKVLLSRPILDQVVSELNLADKNFNPLEYESLVNAIRDSISVQLIGIDILKVTCENRDPVTCQKIVNAITTLFIKHNLELQVRETDAGIEFLMHQKDIYSKKLQESERALREFKQKFQEILSLQTSQQVGELIGAQSPSTSSTMVNVNVLRYTEYKDDLINLNLKLKEVFKTKDQLIKQLGGEQEYVVSERMIDPTVARLKTELAEKQVELARLRVDATDKHPMVRRLVQQIEELKEAIKERRSQAYSSTDKESLNPLYQNIKIDLNKIDSEIESLKTRIKLTELYLQDYAKKIKEIPEREEELSTLHRDYAINASIYADLTKRLETAYLTQRLELQEKGTKFKVVDPARVPLQPFKPNRKFMALGGLAFGMAIGVGLILMAEMTDHSFIEINQLRNFLNIPVLASISQILTIEEAEEIRSRRRLGVLFLFIFVAFMILGGLAKYLLSKPG